VLLWHETEIVAAMYSRSCSGTTKTLAELGRDPKSSYPFYAVACPYHRAHPETWTRDAPAALTEEERIAYNRTHGWSAIPSTTQSRSGDTISGSGIGHGAGLCQVGAADMAAHGLTFDRILAHFYPNTTLRTLTLTR
jgi:hypothetical protein